MEVDIERKHKRVFRYLTVTVHLFGAVHFVYACYYDWFFVDIPSSISPIYNAFGYKFKFLTYWDAITQATYFVFCVIVDFAGGRDNTGERTTLVKIKDYIEASIAFPIAMFVGVTFWGLMAIDRELVLPSSLDPYFPSWLNHMMHTNIIVFQALEILTSPRVYPSRKSCLIGLFTFQSAYLIWMHIVYYKSGVWAYPILDHLNTIQKIGFYAGCIGLGGLLYYAGERLHQFLWAAPSVAEDDDKFE